MATPRGQARTHGSMPSPNQGKGKNPDDNAMDKGDPTPSRKTGMGKRPGARKSSRSKKRA